jgi:hypothetical protein
MTMDKAIRMLTNYSVLLSTQDEPYDREMGEAIDILLKEYRKANQYRSWTISPEEMGR